MKFYKSPSWLFTSGKYFPGQEYDIVDFLESDTELYQLTELDGKKNKDFSLYNLLNNPKSHCHYKFKFACLENCRKKQKQRRAFERISLQAA